MPTDGFFDRVHPWGQWKHRILKKYLHVFVSKLQTRSDVLAFVDACAGEGGYASGEDGSPLIAARWNDEFLRRRGKRLVVIAVEKKAGAANKLEEALRPWIDRTPAEALVVRDSFVRAMPELLDITRGVPTFIFVDPYGMRSIRADELLPLLADVDREATELLLRVDPGLLVRASGWLAPRARSASGQKTAESFRRFLERCNVRPEILDEFASEERAEGMRASRDTVLLAEYLRLFTDRFRYVQLIPIRPSYFAAPKYLLVHGTDSPHGAAKINDAVSTTEDELFTETVRARDARNGQVSMFETEHPSSSRPPAFGVRPPHCFQKNATLCVRSVAETARPFGSHRTARCRSRRRRSPSRCREVELVERAEERLGEMNRTAPASICRSESTRRATSMSSIDVPIQMFGPQGARRRSAARARAASSAPGTDASAPRS
jgi:three-Cys-motif partner protein